MSFAKLYFRILTRPTVSRKRPEFFVSAHIEKGAFDPFVFFSLQALIEKLFPHEIQSVAKKEEGNKVFAKGQLQAALELYTEALALCEFSRPIRIMNVEKCQSCHAYLIPHSRSTVSALHFMNST